VDDGGVEVAEGPDPAAAAAAAAAEAEQNHAAAYIRERMFN
jgi:hypothetical protein